MSEIEQLKNVAKVLKFLRTHTDLDIDFEYSKETAKKEGQPIITRRCDCVYMDTLEESLGFFCDITIDSNSNLEEVLWALDYLTIPGQREAFIYIQFLEYEFKLSKEELKEYFKDRIAFLSGMTGVTLEKFRLILSYIEDDCTCSGLTKKGRKCRGQGITIFPAFCRCSNTLGKDLGRDLNKFEIGLHDRCIFHNSTEAYYDKYKNRRAG